ncbi:Ig-like domain-containing protein [bacterium]|nr:Ig-like domain-containing protein [bacterium]
MGQSCIRQLSLLVGLLLIASSCTQEGDSVTNVTNNGNLAGIRIEANEGYVFIPNITIPLRAIAVFEAGGEQDWTDRVSWSVSSPNWATINSTGLLTPLTTGTGFVKVTHPEGWFSEASFTVHELERLSLTVEDRILLPGERTEVSVSALLDSGGENQLSTDFPLSWEFSQPGVMEIDDRWQLTACQAGQSTLTAVFQDARSVPVIVMTDSIETFSCSMVSSDDSILPSDTLRFSANATTRYAGSITLTDRVQFSSSDPLHLIALENGVFVPIIPGLFHVIATMGSYTAISPDISVWEITAISISPESVPEVLDRGDVVSFTATAQVTGHGSQDLTENLTWESSNVRVARFTAPGQLRAVSSGTTTVSVYAGFVSSSFVEVTVETTPLVEDWEAYPLGSFSDTQIWDVYLPSSDTRVEIVEDGDSGDHVLMIEDSSSSYSPYCLTQDGVLGQMISGVLEADLKAPDSGVIQFLDLVDPYLYSVASVGLTGGTIYLNFDEYNILATFTPGEWLHIVMEFDVATSRFTVYVNDEVIAEDWPFYNWTNTVDYIGVRTYDYAGTAFAGNIVVDAATVDDASTVIGPTALPPDRSVTNGFRSPARYWPQFEQISR